MPRPERDGSVVSISKRGFHRMAYVEWGDPASRQVVVCVHGLSRQGRDFDLIASALARRGCRVISVDLVGRGRSDWLRDPEEYNLPQYVVDLTVLIARLGVPTVDFIGTSLGGLIGIVLAGQPGSPIRRLVVNDIAPFVGWQALHSLSNAVRTAPREFADLEVAVAHYREILAPFGELTDLQWLQMARHSLVQVEGGGWTKLSDPNITAAFRPGWFFNLSLWNYWDAISCPTLLLRGVTSFLVSREIAQEMTRRGPGAALIEFERCGHAPALMDAEQIDSVGAWLEAKS